jgi:phosphate transport system substrate-binding protein
VGYVDLPTKAYTLALENFQKGKTGTGFGGHAEVGVSVEELLQREGKH